MKITTAAPDAASLEGTLYTADALTDLILLDTSSAASAAAEYRILPISRIHALQVLAAGPGLAETKDQISRVDTAALQRRAEERVRALKEAERNRGKGVTREAQRIFDALKRMYVCLPIP